MCLWSDSNYKEKLAARRTQETLLGIPGSKSRCLPIIPSSLYQLWEYVCMDSMGQVLPTQKWQNPLTSPSGPVARLHHWGRLRISPCQWSTCTLPWRMGESTNLKLLILLWLAPLLMKLWNAHDKRTIFFSRFERNARKLQECQDRPHYAHNPVLKYLKSERWAQECAWNTISILSWPDTMGYPNETFRRFRFRFHQFRFGSIQIHTDMFMILVYYKYIL